MIARLLNSALRTGFVYVAFQIIFLQSAGLLAQLLVAPGLGAVEFGVIRVVEAVYSYLTIAAGLGLTAVTAREISRARSETERRNVLATCIRLGLATSALAAPLLYLGVYLAVRTSATDVLPLLLALPAAAFTRTLMGSMQGRGQMRRLGLFGVAAGLLVFGALVTGTLLLGTRGWFAGRAVGELAAAALLAFVTRSQLGGRFQSAVARRALRLGSASTVAILIDRASTLDLVALRAMELVSAAKVGTFGLATAAIYGLLIPAAALNVLILPKLSVARTRVSADALTIRAALLAAGAAGGGAVLLASAAASTSLVQQYENVASIALPMLLAVPLQASTSIFGTRLFAAGQAATSARINAMTTITYLGALVPVALIFGIQGVAILFAVVAAARFFWYGQAVRSLPEPAGDEAA